ncbi:MAG: hypothetical protein WDW36_009031 [Sanguina aurantia]
MTPRSAIRGLQQQQHQQQQQQQQQRGYYKLLNLYNMVQPVETKDLNFMLRKGLLLSMARLERHAGVCRGMTSMVWGADPGCPFTGGGGGGALTQRCRGAQRASHTHTPTGIGPAATKLSAAPAQVVFLEHAALPVLKYSRWMDPPQTVGMLVKLVRVMKSREGRRQAGESGSRRPTLPSSHATRHCRSPRRGARAVGRCERTGRSLLSQSLWGVTGMRG